MAKDMKLKATGKTQASATQLYDFMKRVRAGEPISNYELMKFTPLFNDELTLDNLERVHLVNLCRFVGISPFGTDAFLVSRLRHHLGEIRVNSSFLVRICNSVQDLLWVAGALKRHLQASI